MILSKLLPFTSRRECFHQNTPLIARQISLTVPVPITISFAFSQFTTRIRSEILSLNVILWIITIIVIMTSCFAGIANTTWWIGLIQQIPEPAFQSSRTVGITVTITLTFSQTFVAFTFCAFFINVTSILQFRNHWRWSGRVSGLKSRCVVDHFLVRFLDGDFKLTFHSIISNIEEGLRRQKIGIPVLRGEIIKHCGSGGNLWHCIQSQQFFPEFI